ncbi:MAG: hypothetical protein AAGA47_06370 [Pseudomonadota bacterium]
MTSPFRVRREQSYEVNRMVNGKALSKVRLREGIWEGVLAAKVKPSVAVTHLDEPLSDVTIEAVESGLWRVKVPIPVSALSDGVQTFLISDESSGEKLGSFAISAGSPLSEDLRAEVDLLRAELDMLKRAFRRHCVETGA